MLIGAIYELVHLEACYKDWTDYCSITYDWFGNWNPIELRKIFLVNHSYWTCPYYKEMKDAILSDSNNEGSSAFFGFFDRSRKQNGAENRRGLVDFGVVDKEYSRES